LQSGLSFEERKKLAEQRFEQEQAKKRQEEKRKEEELRAMKVVPQRRWDFVFSGSR
jgi:hypothetical protein